MSNLLDLASIVLTPTAYNNGEALCIKPDDGSGDFQFSRNSAATRVNAQGLVENVQILSSNLVQNGDFSEEGVQEVSNGSFSQEGVEQITNGDFENGSTGWNFQLGWTFDNGQAHFENLGSSNRNLWQSPLVNGNWYKLTFEITAITSGYIRNVNSSVTDDTQFSTIGVHTQYFQAANVNLYLKASVDANLSIDNVSCVEVGQNWTFGTGWSVGEDKVVGDGTMGANVFGQNVGFTQGNTYKFSFTIEDYISGSIYIREPFNGYLEPVNSNGDFSFYYVAGASNQLDFRGNSFNGSITNISVKEVGQNWSFTSGATLTDIGAKITHTPTAGSIAQLSVLTIGKQYKLTYEITESISGGLKFNSAVDASMVTTVGVHTKYFEADGTTAVIGRTSSTDNDVTITNISVIEITDDTNLPRINYEGFSYQDALGSEEVVNGGFDTDSDWDLGTGWSISGGEAVALNSASGQRLTQDNILQVGKIYKLTYEVKSISSGGFKAFVGGVALQSISNIGVYTETMTTPTINDDFFIRTLGTTTGSIDNVSVKEYLGQEVVPDSGCGSWLFEPQSTNLITQSELFSHSSWVKNQTINENATISPSGLQDATKITCTSNGYNYIFRNPSFPSGNYTNSIFLKKDASSGWVALRIWTGGGANGISVWFDLDNNQIGTSNSNVAGFTLTGVTSKHLGNDWYRLSVSGTTDSNSYISLNFVDGDGLNTYTNVSGKSCFIWGAQAEVGNISSYIPTEGTTVTRNQDLCTNGGSLASINSTEGVLYAEIAALADDLTNRGLSISDGTSSNACRIYYINSSNRIRFFFNVGGNAQVIKTIDLTNITDYNKIAFSYKQDDFKIYINGLKVDEDTSGIVPSANTFNKLSFDRGYGGENFFGKTKAVAVWKEALSDTELAELTTI